MNGEHQLDRFARALATDSVSRREVLTRAVGGFVAGALLNPLAAIGATRHRRCTPGHVACAGKCCPPEEVCVSVRERRLLRRKCACPKPKKICRGACKDLARDINHCGACGHRCAKGQLCAHGKCVTHCPAGTTACGTACVNLSTNAADCGACGHACQPGQSCVSGKCAQCRTASDCPGQDTACQTVTCTSGTCGVELAAVNTTCGTNGSMYCDGHGDCVGCNTASECPGQDTACQTRTCVSGTCGTQNAAINSTCGAGGSMFCDGQGTCVGCNTASECPGADTACQTRTCISGTCGTQNAAINTTCGTNGTMYCDGQGTCVGCNTASECPGADTACQTRTCISGTCGTQNAATDTTCGTSSNMFCDGNGTCVGCNTASECGTDTECQTRTCVSGTCGVQNAAVDTQCNGSMFCDGNGACVSCNTPSECPGSDTTCQTRTCISGTCGTQNTAVGTTCGSGMECDGQGACQQCGGSCTVDSNCCGAQWCNGGSCVDKTPNGQPVPNNPPINGVCTPGNGARVCRSGACDPSGNVCGIKLGDGVCSSTSQCISGVCVQSGPNAGKCEPCSSDAQCTSPTPACNTTTNTCVQCTSTNTTACTGSTPNCSSNDTCVS